MISLVIIEEISLLRIGIRTAVEAEGGVDVIADSIPDGDAMAIDFIVSEGLLVLTE